MCGSADVASGVELGLAFTVRIRVRDGARISNRVRGRAKLVNSSFITALSIATSADPHIQSSAFYQWPENTVIFWASFLDQETAQRFHNTRC